MDQPIQPPIKRDEILDCVIRQRGPVQTAANGLQWRVCELEHKYLPTSRDAAGKSHPKTKYRAKLYDLSEFEANPRQWREKTSYLLRHADVCTRIGKHPNIAEHKMAFQDQRDKRRWWVWDEWIDGAVTLEDRLNSGPLRGQELMRCMTGIAAGLQILHKNGIVRRDLSPKFVLLTEKRVVLTDFELAKLLDGSPTVRPTDRAKWEYEIYVAPEANFETIDSIQNGPTSWDLYSWAIIVAHAVSGRRPIDILRARESLKEAAMPNSLRQFCLLCLQPQLDKDQARRRPVVFPPNLFTTQ